MRRAVVILVLAIAVIGGFTGGLAWLLNDPSPPPGASRGERLYYAYCAECHGRDGRGSWRAWLFLLQPGDLTDRVRMASHSDQYLFDIIKQGGAPFGRPGMPAFGYHLPDDSIRALVEHLRTLPPDGRDRAGSPAPPGSAAALDAEGDEAVAFLADGQPQAVARPQPEPIDQVGIDGDGHLFHRGHAEPRNGLVTDEDEIRRGTGDDLALHLVGGGPQDRPPQARREGDEQPGEQEREAPARAGGRVQP
jgi:mono/diheme cytochrome c family protein